MSDNKRLRVHLDFGAGSEPLLLGECLWVDSQRAAAFQWSQAALESGLHLSPLHLPLEPGAQMAQRNPFGGLHGMLADSIPDGFGLRLMDKSLASAGYGRDGATPIHRLAWVGARGLGALTYAPAIDGGEGRQLMEIAELGVHAARADVEDFKDIPEAAIKAGGSAHGARPKFWAAVSSDGQKAILGDDPKVPTGFTPCLVKFAPARGDKNEPFYEAACLELANRHGVSAAKARLLPHPHGAALAVERFDRTPGGGRLFAQSLAALLHDDFRVPKLDYLHLAKVSAKLSADPESERIYRQACFNAALCMRDDHSKNFAFRMDRSGKWELSPAFDLCPSQGPAGWHTMTISGNGVDIARSDLLRLAGNLGLAPAIAADGIDQALSASSQFEAIAIDLGAQRTGAKAWGKIFLGIHKELAPAAVATASTTPAKAARKQFKGLAP